MNPNDQANEVTELFRAQTHIYKHMYNFIESMALKSALQLTIPDIIHNHNKPISLIDLASALNVPPANTNPLERLMRILVQSGFFAIEQEGYTLTPSSRILLDSSPITLSPTVLAILDPLLVTPWFSLADWLKSEDATVFETHFGMNVWDYGKKKEGFVGLLNDAMASDSRLVSLVVEEHREVFDGLGSLVDVGGGTGTLARVVSEKFPLMDCTVLDLPQVVAELGGSKNLKFVGGDMFQSIPSADAVLIKSVLHNWSDEKCVKILKRCKEAIPKKAGKLILIEMVIDEGKEGGKLGKTRLFVDMEMMMLCGGRERTEKEWEHLFLESGFSCYKIIPTTGLNSIIEVYP
ncbi:unnamed protein product [Linum trigynum]|uniref:Uncharacterized protein n=1 Tax=Linum trigynum TaxID=586398 RepID=A0AAV2ERQ4_9ROSI